LRFAHEAFFAAMRRVQGTKSNFLMLLSRLIQMCQHRRAASFP
jgi:hypothetical protein